jgi:hypothetical protein
MRPEGNFGERVLLRTGYKYFQAELSVWKDVMKYPLCVHARSVQNM